MRTKTWWKNIGNRVQIPGDRTRQGRVCAATIFQVGKVKSFSRIMSPHANLAGYSTLTMDRTPTVSLYFAIFVKVMFIGARL